MLKNKELVVLLNEIKNEKDLSWRFIANEIGIHVETLRDFRKGNANRRIEAKVADFVENYKGSDKDFIHYGYIYKITNQINGKVYIGLTTKKNPRTRLQQHLRYAKGSKEERSYIHSAIAKYGEENFEFEVIESNIHDREELQQLEIDYITNYNSFGEGGYNRTTGGEGGLREGRPIVQLDKDTGKFINEFPTIIYACNELDINYGTMMSHLNGVSKTTNGFIFEYKDLYEAEDYEFQPIEFKYSPRVVQLDKTTGKLLGRYSSFINASRATGVSVDTISRMVNGKGNADDSIWMAETEYNAENFVLNLEDYVTNGVVQLDKETGELINKYYSIKEAAEACGTSISNISSSFKRNNYAVGYVWILLEEYNNGFIFDKYDYMTTIAVVQLDKDTGEYIATYDSGTIAAKALGLGIATHIAAVCKGKRHTSGGYRWLYYTDYRDGARIDFETKKATEEHIKGQYKKKFGNVQQIDKVTGELVAVFTSYAEAHRETGIRYQSIRSCAIGGLPEAGGYIWKRIKSI